MGPRRVVAAARAERVDWFSSLGFLGVHLACFAAIWTGVTWRAVELGIALYFLRIFAIGAGYHRYFSHRSFKTSRVFHFILGFLAQSSAQRGILWWAAHHRNHHKNSDTEFDTHSPILRGFLYAHVGWILVPKNEPTDYTLVRDLTQYKELLWLEHHPYIAAILLAVLSFLIAGLPGLVVGFCWSTVAVWHATFSINSLAHLFGYRRYVTGDHSRNNWLLAILTMGEGWHNNHHAYQASVRQGFRWWEYDVTYYVLRVLAWLGIVWDLHLPPKALIKGKQRLGHAMIERAARQLALSFPINAIATQVVDALSAAPRWADLKARVAGARLQAEAFWSEMELPGIPSLEDVRNRARARLAATPSLDDIAIAARKRLLELVYSRVCEVTASGGTSAA